MIKKIPLLPNAITAFGLCCGLFVIFKVNMVDPGESSYAGLLGAAGLLLIAALADVLDGAVARAMKAETEFGGIFDCLADAVSFGVAPSVLFMKALSVAPGTELAFLVTTGAIVYSLCGVLRLVRFSVSAMQAKSDDELMAAHKKNFTGLPIPAAAAAAVSAVLLLFSPEFNSLVTVSETQRAVALFSVMFVLGYFMISRWKFPSIKTLQFRVASFQLVFVVVIFAVCIFYGLRYHFAIVFFSLAWSYLLVAWALSIYRIIAGRRTKALEDFEPDESE